MEFLDQQNRTTFSKYPIFCYNGADVCRLAIEQMNSGCTDCSVAKGLADQSRNAVVLPLSIDRFPRFLSGAFKEEGSKQDQIGWSDIPIRAMSGQKAT